MTSHTQKSLETKNRLSASLKTLMQQTDFNKISIDRLVRDARLNRNSFYYHFNNIFDLLKYTFENDTTKIITEINLNHNIKKAIYLTLDYIDQNRAFCTCAYKSLGKTELKKFLKNNFQDIIANIIKDIINKNQFVISPDFQNYIIYSHAELITIHTIGYLEKKINLTKKQIAGYILLTFNRSIVSSLEIANQNQL